MTKILAHLEKDPTAKPASFIGPLGERVPDVNARTRFVIRNSDGARLGVLRCRRDGWRFYPAYQRAPNRKGWPTASQAVKNYGILLTPAPRPDIAGQIGTGTTAFQRLTASIDALGA